MFKKIINNFCKDRYFIFSVCLCLISLISICIRIIPISMPLITKMLLICPIISIFVFLLFTSIKDAHIKDIANWQGILFICIGIILYTIRIIVMKTSFADVQEETFSMVFFFLGIMLLGRFRKWNKKASFLCVGVAIHYLAVFGKIYFFILLITILTACVCFFLYSIVCYMRKSDKSKALIPYLYVSCCIILSILI